MSLRDHLRTVTPPWVQLLVSGRAPLASLRPLPPDFVVREIDGRRCGTRAACLAEISRALAFPAYFGGNWDALDECLSDLEWLPGAGYLLVFRDADRLLTGAEEDYRTLIDVLEGAGQEWSAPRSSPPRAALPFHAILAVTSRGRRARRDWGVPAAAVDRERPPPRRRE